MFKKKIKFFLIIVVAFFTILLISIKFNVFNLNKYYYFNLPTKLKLIAKNVNQNSKSGQGFTHLFNNLFNDYNVKFLPNTQFIDLNFKTKKINFDESFQITSDKIEFINKTDRTQTHFLSYYFDLYNNDIILADYVGNIYFVNHGQIINDENIILPKKLNSNLKVDKILDILIYKNELYVSFANIIDGCYNWNISKSEISIDNLEFSNIYSSKECTSQNFYQPHGGRMQAYNHKGTSGILFTVGANSPEVKDNNSIVGKILFISLEDFQVSTFSEGHRNTQGLYVHNNTIFSTEHGPKGGDEINKILFEKNYGWPYASYGEPYGSKRKKPGFLKSHIEFGYEEPMYVFLKAIGISELIYIPEEFSPFWGENLLVSSLWGQSIYRMKFDKNFNKNLFYEKIYIGQRIRDLKYHENSRSIFLALEENGELAIIKSK
tara:strand:- start:128 stop:1429 length:1302 start_codon:yes stop_codon:yes gene_type:complete